MPVLTVRRPLIELWSLGSAYILCVCDRLQVVRVVATWITAQVVNLQPLGDGTVERFVSVDVLHLTDTIHGAALVPLAMLLDIVRPANLMNHSRTLALISR